MTGSDTDDPRAPADLSRRREGAAATPLFKRHWPLRRSPQRDFAGRAASEFRLGRPRYGACSSPRAGRIGRAEQGGDDERATPVGPWRDSPPRQPPWWWGCSSDLRHRPAPRMAACSMRVSAWTGKGISMAGSGSSSRGSAAAAARLMSRCPSRESGRNPRAAGPQGPQGKQGIQGPAGTSGTARARGPARVTGSSGASGADRAQGREGPAGPRRPSRVPPARWHRRRLLGGGIKGILTECGVVPGRIDGVPERPLVHRVHRRRRRGERNRGVRAAPRAARHVRRGPRDAEPSDILPAVQVVAGQTTDLATRNICFAD